MIRFNRCPGCFSLTSSAYDLAENLDDMVHCILASNVGAEIVRIKFGAQYALIPAYTPSDWSNITYIIALDEAGTEKVVGICDYVPSSFGQIIFNRI